MVFCVLTVKPLLTSLRTAAFSNAGAHVSPARHTRPLAPVSLVVRKVSQTLTGESECTW